MSGRTGPRVLCVAGPSGSGKTTLLRRLLARLPVPPDRIGVLKHTHHALDWHPAGKDSAALWDAGPAALGVAGPDQTAVFVRAAGAGSAAGSAAEPGEGHPAGRTHSTGRATRALAAACRRMPGGLRLILVEGFRSARAPKIWTAGGPPDAAPPGPATRAIVVPADRTAAWAAAHPGVEVRSREEADELAARIPGWAAPVVELTAG